MNSNVPDAEWDIWDSNEQPRAKDNCQSQEAAPKCEAEADIFQYQSDDSSNVSDVEILPEDAYVPLAPSPHPSDLISSHNFDLHFPPEHTLGLSASSSSSGSTVVFEFETAMRRRKAPSEQIRGIDHNQLQTESIEGGPVSVSPLTSNENCNITASTRSPTKLLSRWLTVVVLVLVSLRTKILSAYRLAAAVVDERWELCKRAGRKWLPRCWTEWAWSKTSCDLTICVPSASDQCQFRLFSASWSAPVLFLLAAVVLLSAMLILLLPFVVRNRPNATHEFLTQLQEQLNEQRHLLHKLVYEGQKHNHKDETVSYLQLQTEIQHLRQQLLSQSIERHEQTAQELQKLRWQLTEFISTASSGVSRAEPSSSQPSDAAATANTIPNATPYATPYATPNIGRQSAAGAHDHSAQDDPAQLNPLRFFGSFANVIQDLKSKSHSAYTQISQTIEQQLPGSHQFTHQLLAAVKQLSDNARVIGQKMANQSIISEAMVTLDWTVKCGKEGARRAGKAMGRAMEQLIRPTICKVVESVRDVCVASDLGRAAPRGSAAPGDGGEARQLPVLNTSGQVVDDMNSSALQWFFNRMRRHSADQLPTSAASSDSAEMFALDWFEQRMRRTSRKTRARVIH